MAGLKGSLGLVVPSSRYNHVLNPSAEIAGNFSSQGGAATAQSTFAQKYGARSFEVLTFSAGDGINLTLYALDSSPYFVTFRERQGNTYSRVRFNVTIGSKTREAQVLEKIDDTWNLYGAPFTDTEAYGQTNLRITQIESGSSVIYIDGVQVENTSDGTYSTFIDGTQEGCRWLGAPHASRSQRSAESKAGGVVKDFYKEYGFFVERIIGAGAASQANQIDSYAQLPGGELNQIKIQSREFVVQGWFLADTEERLHENIQALELALSHDAHPGDQPNKIRFYGSKVQKEISAYYKGGLEGDLAAFYDRFSVEDDEWKFNAKFREKAAIQFDAPDPSWYEVGESAVVLETNSTATFTVVAGRLASTGQWSNLGPPNAAGTYTAIQDMVEDDVYVYIGGSFLNFDNIANADGIVRYNKQTGVYSALGTGTSSTVYALALGPDGRLYAAGNFTTIGGTAANRVAVWDGASWSALGSGLNNTVFALAYGPGGRLYVAGQFTTAGGSGANQIAYWDGAAWNAMGSGLDAGLGLCLAIGIDGLLYVGGTFTTANGNTVNRMAYWDGSDFQPLGTGFDDVVQAIAIDRNNGLIYAFGLFTTAGSISASRAAVWNGVAWDSLGSGLSSDATSAGVDLSGVVYVAGTFTTAGGLTLNDGFAQWNGYAWARFDIDLPGTPSGTALIISKFTDAVVSQKYDIFIGFDTTGTGSYADLADVTNEGSWPAFPQIIINRSGGTGATIQSIRNERTGLTLLCDYDLLDGETVTIDLTPDNRKETSSFFGPVAVVLPNSNMSQWNLLAGDNQVSAFVSESGSPTITAYLLWRDAYRSWN